MCSKEEWKKEKKEREKKKDGGVDIRKKKTRRRRRRKKWEKKSEEASWESVGINTGVGIGGGKWVLYFLSENNAGRLGLILNGDNGGRWKSVGIGWFSFWTYSGVCKRGPGPIMVFANTAIGPPFYYCYFFFVCWTLF